MASQAREIKEITFGKGKTKVIVDGFAFPNPFVRHYFLTHMHSDHTVGLRKSFASGLIWCSEAAANLLRHDFGLHNTQIIRSLPLNRTVTVAGGLQVTAISANHSPDAVMFVFDYQDGDVNVRVVHTGDMRWTSDMLEAADGILLKKPVDRLYLDTTYLNPRYTFPTQDAVVVAIGNWMRQQMLAEPETYFAFHSYHIGKERAFFGAAEFLNMAIYVTDKKRAVLDLLDLPERWTKLMVRDPTAARIRVGGRVNEDEVYEDVKKLGLARGVIIRPTGWAYRRAGPLVTSRVSAHGVIVASAPYSEHSNYSEIRECVKSLKPRRVIPTVGGAGDALVEKELIGLMDLKDDKRRIDSYFSSRSVTKKSREARHDPGEARSGVSERQVIDLVGCPDGPVHLPESNKLFDIGRVDVAEQRRILEELSSREDKNHAPGHKKPTIMEKFFRTK